MISSSRRSVIGVSTSRPRSSLQVAGVPFSRPSLLAQFCRNHYLALGADDGAIGCHDIILP